MLSKAANSSIVAKWIVRMRSALNITVNCRTYPAAVAAALTTQSSRTDWSTQTTRSDLKIQVTVARAVGVVIIHVDVAPAIASPTITKVVTASLTVTITMLGVVKASKATEVTMIMEVSWEVVRVPAKVTIETITIMIIKAPVGITIVATCLPSTRTTLMVGRDLEAVEANGTIITTTRVT